MRRLTMAVTALALLVMPAAAAAFAMPNPADQTIRPPTKLAGIALGDSFADAMDAWGAQGHCEINTNDSLCVYGEPTSRKGGAQFFCRDGHTVNDVSIFAGLSRKGFAFKGPLLDIETARGHVGLGDPVKKLEKAYPKLKKKQRHAYELAAHHDSMTVHTWGRKERITLFELKSG